MESMVWRELKKSGNSSLPQLRLLSRWDEWLILTKSPKQSSSLPQMRAVMAMELNCSSMGVRHRSNRSVQLEKRIMPRPATFNSDELLQRAIRTLRTSANAYTSITNLFHSPQAL